MDKSEAKVLVADDSGMMRKHISGLVAEAGYGSITVVENGKEAVVKAIAERPNLVLLDVNMPVMGGIEALGKIAAILPDAVMVMMTSDSDPDIIDQCMDLGAANYILKEDPKEEVLSVIDECWETAQAE